MSFFDKQSFIFFIYLVEKQLENSPPQWDKFSVLAYPWSWLANTVIMIMQ